MLSTQALQTIHDQNAKTDIALAYEITRAFKTENILRALDYFEIDVNVENGIAYLDGHIMNTANQRRIEKLIWAVPGIKEIINNLVLDDSLTLEVAATLVLLENTYDCKLFTGSSHGVVSINGVVHSNAVKLLAEQCVAGNFKVRGVINNIRIAGTGLELQNEPFLQPAIGETIFFLDGISGVVKQVIIDPNNRRVTQVIIQGKFSSEIQGRRFLINSQSKLLDKTVAIPMTLIRYLTKSSGFLNIKSTETTQYEDFNPLYFIIPETDWIPPYPYFLKDTLFAIKTKDTENQIMIDPDIEQLNISAQPTTPLKTAKSIDILSTWEDDGGQIVQTAESVNLP